jgi:tyrosine-protein kinase Etk/Wzc
MATGTLKPGILAPASEQDERGVDLLGITVALASEWRLGVVTFLIALVALTLYIFTLQPQYVASAVILPQGGHAVAMGSLSSLFSSGGPGGMYMGLLKSRSVQDEVMDRTDFMRLVKVKSREKAREVLAGKSTFTSTPDSLLEIKVKDKDAQVAAQIANAYLDALKNLNNRMSLEQSAETGDFFKSQIQQEREELGTAETKLESTEQRTGIVQPEAQTQIGLTAIAQVRQQITQLQVELAALLRGATEENPQVQRVQSQIAQLQAQEREMEKGTQASPAGAAPPAQQLPSTNLDVLRAQREVTFHNALVTALGSQFEMARTEEAAARPEFQVVDRAIAPEHKAWPPRRAFLIAAFVVSILIALIAVVIRLVWRRVDTDPEHQAQLARLRQAVARR